ncbi:hypothetical protein FUAX_09040 [Fulvitalea axinellae]|uniref:Uncharacterized protein n=1 Tax=Fulvitalea axinellae TaxID=1182444 RepID=A0AAU9CKM3_9BACT|nr:hypothetical protein FUAX_09040 [Fulvitalea axinellae]
MIVYTGRITCDFPAYLPNTQAPILCVEIIRMPSAFHEIFFKFELLPAQTPTVGPEHGN